MDTPGETLRTLLSPMHTCRAGVEPLASSGVASRDDTAGTRAYVGLRLRIGVVEVGARAVVDAGPVAIHAIASRVRVAYITTLEVRG